MNFGGANDPRSLRPRLPIRPALLRCCGASMKRERLYPATGNIDAEATIIEMANALKGMHSQCVMRMKLRQLFGDEKLEAFGADAIERERMRAELFPSVERKCA